MKKTRTSTFQNKPDQAGASMKKIWGARKNKVPEVNFPGIGQKKMLLNAREIIGLEGAPHLILLAMEVIAPVGDKEETGNPDKRDGRGH